MPSHRDGLSTAAVGAGARLHCVRLCPGDDVLKVLLDFVTERGLRAAAVVSSVGSTGRTRLRPAGGGSPRTFDGKYEVVALSGTIAPGGTVDGDIFGGADGEKHHLHLSVSGPDCSTVGGHLLAGTIVRTTLEVVIAELVGTVFDRPLDPRTGFAELSIKSAMQADPEVTSSLSAVPSLIETSGTSHGAAPATLRFNEAPLGELAIARLRRQLRQEGYCILPDVYERQSVLSFDAAVRSKLERGRKFDVFGNPTDFKTQPGYRDQLWLPNNSPEIVEPIRAPRIKQFIPSTLTPTNRPAKVQVFECAWLVDEQTEPGSWHKDYPHYEEMDLVSYQCPEAIYLAIYLRDMTEDTGPTQLVPTSHRDLTLNPNDERCSPPVVSFTTRAQDVVVWDQRTWHRRGPGGGGADHPRINAIFGFQSIQTEGSNRDAPYLMHPALARAWLETEDPADQLWFGGKWSPQSIAAEMAKLRDERDDARRELAELRGRL